MGGKDRTSPRASSRSTLSSISNRTPRSDGYYLECRKDAQCNCSMCKASITATLDLRTAQPFQTTSKENQPWPPPFPSVSPVAPPLSKKCRQWSSTCKASPQNLQKFALKGRCCWAFFCFLLIPLALLAALPWALSFIKQGHFDHNSFNEMAQASLVRKRLIDRLDFVQRSVSQVYRSASVSNCTGHADAWRLSENGHLVHSHCDIYASPLEKISVWGYAAKTGGVLGRSLVDRSFTVLAGQLVEWQEGHLQYIVHPEGSSWTMQRWAASAILLDGDTWILEYRRSPLTAGLGGAQGLMHLVRSGFGRVLGNAKLYFDTAFFVYMRGLDIYAHHALSAWRVPPT